MIATVILLALLIIASLTDIYRHKIYNWTTYTGILMAIGLSLLASFFGLTEMAQVDFRQSLFGLLVCGGVMVVCFALFQIGGGDVKLLAMIGAFVGPAGGLEVLLWTFVLGAAVAVIILIWKFGAVDLLFAVLGQLFNKLQWGKWQTLSEQQKAELQTPLYLAPCALPAFLIVYLMPITALTGNI